MANNEGIDIIIKATDQYTATINKIAASNKIFGQSVESTQKQVSALERYMVALVANGLDPADAKIVQLKADYDRLSASLNSGQGALKSSSKQWTSLALVVQDLPYGFRGIQNNLPALFGSIAAAAGPAYFAFSALIAAITFWDQESQKAAATTKSLYENFNKLKTETLSLGSIFSAVREGTLSASDATKIYNEKLGDLFGTAKNVYEAEQLYVKKTEGYIKAQYYRAKADIQYEKAKEALAKKDAAYAEDQVGILGKLAIATGAFFKSGAIQGIAGFYKQGTIFAKDYADQQIELAGYVSDYQEAQFQKNLALGERYFSQAYKLEEEYGIKSTAIKDKTDKAAIAALGKAIQKQQNVNEQILQNAIDAKKQEIKLFEDDAYKKFEVSKQLAELEKALALEKIKNGEYTTKQQLALQEGVYVEYSNKLLLLDQAMQEQLLAQDDKTAKAKKKTRELEIKEAIHFTEQRIKAAETEADASIRANRGNYQAQKKALEELIVKLGVFRMAGVGGAEGMLKLDEAITNSKAKIAGLVDPLETLNQTLQNVFNQLDVDLLVNFGEQIGNMLAGGKFDFTQMGTILADALSSIGKALIAYALTNGAVLELFKDPKTWPLALAAGIAAVAAGTALKSKINNNKATAFANGGIVSGPTMGLVGEYPGAQNNPEVIAPLDKLKDMIGGGGGGTFVLRGQDLLLSVNRAQKASNLKGQNISLA
jgi:hypothetical protein